MPRPHSPAPRRPWHLTPLAMLAVLWHLAAAVDYTMVRLAYAPYLQQFPAEWVDWFAGVPLWAGAAWALAVWLGLLGAVLLLMRERGAVLCLAGAALAMVVANLWFLALASPRLPELTGPGGLWVMLAASAVPVLFWLYARWLKRGGRLG